MSLSTEDVSIRNEEEGNDQELMMTLSHDWNSGVLASDEAAMQIIFTSNEGHRVEDDEITAADSEACYETIYEDVDSEFIMVPNISFLSEEDEFLMAEQIMQLDLQSAASRSTVARYFHSFARSITSSSWDDSTQSSPFVTTVKARVGSAASTGAGWIRSSGRRMKRSILRSAARTNHQMTEQSEWISDTTVSGGWTDGGECRLLLPGQLIVLGEPLSQSPIETNLSGAEVLRPEVTVDESPPKKIMVSAHDLLAMSHADNSDSDGTTGRPRSNRVMSTKEMQLTEAIVNIFHLNGLRMAYSAKRKITRATSSSIGLLKAAGSKLVSLENKYHVIETASELISDGCEKIAKPFQSRQQSGSDENIAIELTT